MNNYKSNINYFTKWEDMKTCGMGMLIVGILFIWVAWVWIWFLYLVGMFLIVAGAILFFLGNAGRSTDDEIMSEVNRRKEGIEFPEIETERDYQKRTPHRPEIIDLEGFSFREGLYIKKRKNGSMCSSEFACARIFLLTDAFYIKSRSFSLVSAGETNETYEIPFTTVENIELESERQTFPSGKKSYSVAVSHLVITYDGGRKLRLPGKDDAYSDELVARLGKIVEKAKTEQS